MKKSVNVVYIAALIILLGLLIFSIVLYKQRILFVDPSWIVFQIINTNFFSFSEYRYGAFITQQFPLVGQFLGLKLKTILILYSVSFYLFYFVVAYIVGFVWKEKRMSILFVLYLSVFVSDVYFWPNNEVHQGIGWMFLFLGYYTYCSNNNNNALYAHSLLIIFLLLSISCHLLVSISLLFLWIYINVLLNNSYKECIKDKRFLVYSFLILLTIFIRYILSKDSGYDGEKLAAVKGITLNNLLASFSNDGAKTFLHLLSHKYVHAIGIFALGIGYMLKKRQFLIIAWVLLFTIGYYSLVFMTYPSAFQRDLLFYMESEWMGLILIGASPLVFQILPHLKVSHAIVAFAIIFLVSLLNMRESYSYFNNRLQKLQNTVLFLEKNNINKALLVQKNASKSQGYIMTWGLPVESLILSSIMDKHQPAISFKLVDTTFENTNKNQDIFYSCFGTERISNIDTNYFKVDSKSNYSVFILK